MRETIFRLNVPAGQDLCFLICAFSDVSVLLVLVSLNSQICGQIEQHLAIALSIGLIFNFAFATRPQFHALHQHTLGLRRVLRNVRASVFLEVILIG